MQPEGNVSIRKWPISMVSNMWPEQPILMQGQVAHKDCCTLIFLTQEPVPATLAFSTNKLCMLQCGNPIAICTGEVERDK